MKKTILALVLLFIAVPCRAAHFVHSPIWTVGPNTVEASKIEMLSIISPPGGGLTITAVVKNGKYNTSVNAATAVTGNSIDDTAVSGGTYSDKNRSRTYTVTVMTAGTLGVAAVSWTTDKKDDEGGPVVVPVGGKVGIGTKGVELTFGTGPDNLLTLNNKWTVSGVRTFVETAPGSQLNFLGAKAQAAAASAPDCSQGSIFGVTGKAAYGAIASEMGWSGSVQALDEF
jgi:hypothetical protein